MSCACTVIVELMEEGTGDDVHKFYFQEVRWDESAGNWAVYEDGVTDENLGLAVDTTHIAKPNDIVELNPVMTNNEDRIWVVGPHLPRMLFAVDISQSGGQDGSNTAQASWTYTASVLDGGAQLGANLEPLKQRPAKGRITPGGGTGSEVGIGYLEQDRTFQLFDPNEVPTVEECS